VNPDERTDRTPPEDLRRLLSELVRRVERGTDPTTAREDVILDTDVEGVRCIFIRQPEADADHAIQLSPREREIVRMVAAGYPNKTIGTHLRHVFAKLGVSSRAAMVSRLHAIGRIGPLDRA
jgi:DNA-binding CsgD family transcriptional regulator